MAWSGERRGFVVELFIQNGGMSITTQRAFRISSALNLCDPNPDMRNIYLWVSNYRETSSALKQKSQG